MSVDNPSGLIAPIRVGIIGTGYAARARAQAFGADNRAQLLAVAGHTLEGATALARPYRAEVSAQWQRLISRTDIDLVVVCHINSDHAAVVRAALEAGKAVVVEYPLGLSLGEAQSLVALAESRGLFLHVEHIELLGGLHHTVKAQLEAIGTPAYVRYKTVTPKTPAPKKWTYNPDLFGFPLVGALSRFHRLTDLFGSVQTVTSQLRYDFGGSSSDQTYYTTCRCTAQLTFANGVLAEVLYGKGEQVWQPARYMEVQGDRGALVFEGDQGMLLQDGRAQPLTLQKRRGLFAQDTTAVLDALLDGKPMYVSLQASLYTLTVATAAARSAATGQTIYLEEGVDAKG